MSYIIRIIQYIIRIMDEKNCINFMRIIDTMYDVYNTIQCMICTIQYNV
jgi:hypothetical protein